MPITAWLQRVSALVRAHPRKAGAGAAAVVAAASLATILLKDDDRVHLPRPQGVRPIVMTIAEGALPAGAPRPAVPKYDPAYAGTPSAALELVRSANGKLAKPFRAVRDCSPRPCVTRVVIRKGGVVVFDGARWTDGYIPTGHGEEVFRLREQKAAP